MNRKVMQPKHIEQDIDVEALEGLDSDIMNTAINRAIEWGWSEVTIVRKDDGGYMLRIPEMH